MAINQFQIVCLASKMMRLAMHRPSFDPESAPKPSIRPLIEAARAELASRQPSTIDCGVMGTQEEQNQPAVVTTIDAGTF
jgi:hypothetical protein